MAISRSQSMTVSPRFGHFRTTSSAAPSPEPERGVRSATVDRCYSFLIRVRIPSMVPLRRLGRSPSNFDHLNHMWLGNSQPARSPDNATTFKVGREQCSAQYVYSLFLATKSVLIGIHSQLWIVTFFSRVLCTNTSSNVNDHDTSGA